MEQGADVSNGEGAGVAAGAAGDVCRKWRGRAAVCAAPAGRGHKREGPAAPGGLVQGGCGMMTALVERLSPNVRRRGL